MNKIAFVFLFISLALCTLSVKAQNARITLKEQNVPLENVISEIENRTNYLFVVRNVDTARRVSIDVENKTIGEVLIQLLRGTDSGYKIEGNNIILDKAVPAAGPVSVSGVVRDAGGPPVIGAVVMVEGSSVGTVTDHAGAFTINVSDPASAILTVSYLGYQTQSVAVGSRTVITVEMQSTAVEMEGVVVTALGIRRQEKALSYNVQTVAGDELTTVASANFVNSLAGKVAGVQFNPSSGPGGAVKVVSRGTKSLQGSNNVLYVIDGIPMRNAQTNTQSRAASEGGNYADPVSTEGIADLNPDDFESVTMLTGPAAAALYGYEGANGAILITTKKGTAEKTTISLSNNTTLSSPLVLPEFQHEYTSDDNYHSWGPKGKVAYDPADFFRLGFNTTTSLSVQSGKGSQQVYFSAANTTAEGILPGNTYDRYNFSMRYTTAFLKERMTLDAAANYIIQNDENMVSEGLYFNPLPGLYLYPRSNSFADLKNYQYLDPVSGYMNQNWGYNGIMESNNPYWVMNNMNRENQKRRYMFTASLKYDITEWLNIMGRVNVDNSDSEGTWKFKYGTQGSLNTLKKGHYQYRTLGERQIYADVLLNFNKSFGKFSVYVNAGGSIKDFKESNHLIDGDIPVDGFTNLFTAGNLGSNATNVQDGWRQQVQSVFANAEVGYDGMVYITLTGRNDWDSTLALGDQKFSFFYPSVGLSVVFDKMFRMPEGFDFAKLRFSRTQVGSGVPGRYAAYPPDNRPYIYEAGVFKVSQVYPYINPQHEKTVSYEAGMDLRFLGGALTFDATWYLSNTFNQTFEVPVDAANPEFNGATSWLIQAGNIQNTGVEVSLGFNKEWSMGLGWRTSLTYSYNDNKIVDLISGVKAPVTGTLITYDNSKPVAQLGGDGSPEIRLVVGGSASDMYIRNYEWVTRPNGELLIDQNNLVSTKLLNEYENMGPMSAHSYAGWSNSLSYKGITLGFQFRGRFGGWVYSSTQAHLDFFGVSKYSAELREKGSVRVMGRGVLAGPYLKALSEGGGRGKHYIYDASNIRLGEVNLSYTMPRKWFGDVVGITVGFVASNVAMLWSKAPFDPEQTANASYTYYNGVDNFMIPSTRNLGFNIKLQF